jgi:glycosyltransferase involved in cell wall biosynthesis
VQAQAAGRPVIAYGAGGALDTVLPRKTGEHFDALTVESLIEAMARFEPGRYDPVRLRDHALQFDTRQFNERMQAFMEQAWENFQRNRARR